MGERREEWANVEGFDNAYEVSSFGRVRRSDDGRLLTPYVGSGRNEYAVVHLGGRRPWSKFVRVHRLMCAAFMRPLLPGEEVNHLDGNKTNNDLLNLEITDRIGNQRHAWVIGLHKPVRGERHGMSRLTDDKVRSAREMRSAGTSYQKIANALGVSKRTARLACTGESWRHVA